VRAVACDHPGVVRSSGSRSGAQSVERALDVLRSFESAPGDLGVSEIAARTGLSVSTAHRLTRALCVGGLLVQDPRTERYQLGPALVVLGRRAEQRLGYARALPSLEALADKTGESVNVGIRSGPPGPSERSGWEVLVVLDVASPQPLRFDQEPGSRVAIHASAMGKCLLAFSADPSGEVRELARSPGLVRFTDRTLADPAALEADLMETRRRGWALNDEERNLGVRAVAAPVLDAAGVAVAAVAVQGPTVRLADSRLDDLAGLLTATTRTLSPFLAPG
jgi:IclR family transcriptional regulator, acetate operon repressor